MNLQPVKVVLLALAIVGLLLVAAPPTVHAASGTLRVDPPAQTVPGSTEFTITVKQNADVATIGAQTSLRFDPGILEVVSIEAGAPYAAAQLLQPEGAIPEANGTGLLRCIATFFVPGSGTIPPGDADFLKITMRAKAGGTSALDLVGEGCETAVPKLEMLDDQGTVIPVTGTGGSVTVSGAAPPQPGVTVAPTQTPAGTPTTAIGTLVAVNTPSTGATSAATADSTGGAGSTSENTISFSPITSEVEKGEAFEVDIVTRSTVPVGSAAVQLSFDPDVVTVTGIEAGSAWSGAAGAAQSNLDTAIAQANETGSIEIAFSASTPLAAGEQTFVTLQLEAADKDARTLFNFVSSELTTAEGSAIEYVEEAGEVIVGSGGGGGIDVATIALLSMLTLSVGATGGGTYYMVKRRRRQWAV